ncbi:hotdog fold thioesterase [Paenibacillus polysaccharolyticus]|uniref:hotdog fold domain-containing protein n=1 Tax=Paenibacillus polysaccharolyticus TaxID=582692 RepID=UPI00203F8002|nr:hotdog fold domain-containing protein [Paenibacillus polysaccharolyticus]MCM3135798.1 hotdog fold thioesterase [Paenibacillus polysaccharolyticus]
MDYMKMVHYLEISSSEVLSGFIYKDNEEFCELDKPVIVPMYLLLEAFFQTAGKVAREYSNNKSGGSIVSVSNLYFKRPILSNEYIRIRANLVSFNVSKRCFFFKLSVCIEEEVVISDADIIIKQEEGISSKYLNNSTLTDKEKILEIIGALN